MSFFDKLESLIEKKNTTFTELERNVGLGRGTISNWKTSNPTYDKLIKVVNYLNADILWLISDDLKTTYNYNANITDKSNSLREERAVYNATPNNIYTSVDIETQEAINVLLKKISSQLTPEEKRILSLYNLLDEKEKIKIEGILELKVQECSDRKKNFLYSYKE